MKKFGTFILLILMFVLIAGLGFFSWMIYTDLFDADVTQTLQTSDSIVGVDDEMQTRSTSEKKSIREKISDIFTAKEQPKVYSSQTSEGKYYYEQLNETQKIIYNGLQENKDNLVTGTYKIEFGSKFEDILSREDGSKVLGDDYQTAMEAFTHDNADLFYLDITKLYLNMETKKKAFSTTYNVFLAPKEDENYFADGFSSETQVRIAVQKVEEVKNSIKAKLTTNTYNNIKLIHDYLVNNIEYDQEYKSIGKYSIYGALVEKRCVCEGYARAFKYLADNAGISCILMQGTATNKEGKTEKHAWNAVYLNDKWYLIDVTWNDPIIVGRGILPGGIHYKYFLKGSNTFRKDHTLERCFTDGGKNFSYTNISQTDF